MAVLILKLILALGKPDSPLKIQAYLSSKMYSIEEPNCAIKHVFSFALERSNKFFAQNTH